MINVERILFPVDLSEQSKHAAPFVKAMAKRFHSEVAMLHVFEVRSSWYAPQEGVAWDVSADIEQFREERQAEFDSFLVQEFAGVRVIREMAEGDPASQINCYAKTKNVGLIMMPTHGYGVFRRLLLGSVTAKVLHDAKCPVWTGVHAKGLTSPDPERCRSILCAVDTNPKDAHVIQWAQELAQQQAAKLHVIHAVTGANGAASVDAPFREFLFKVAREDMEKMLLQANVKSDVTLHGGKPESVVHDGALEVEADMVVIGRGVEHALGRLRSNAYAIIRESPCPVISV